jgi:hypothetical protein
LTRFLGASLQLCHFLREFAGFRFGSLASLLFLRAFARLSVGTLTRLFSAMLSFGDLVRQTIRFFRSVLTPYFFCFLLLCCFLGNFARYSLFSLPARRCFFGSFDGLCFSTLARFLRALLCFCHFQSESAYFLFCSKPSRGFFRSLTRLFVCAQTSISRALLRLGDFFCEPLCLRDDALAFGFLFCDLASLLFGALARSFLFSTLARGLLFSLPPECVFGAFACGLLLGAFVRRFLFSALTLRFLLRSSKRCLFCAHTRFVCPSLRFLKLKRQTVCLVGNVPLGVRYYCLFPGRLSDRAGIS